MVGAEVLRLSDHAVTVGGITLNEGDWLSLDGGAGIVVAGQVPMTAASPPPEFAYRVGFGPTRSARVACRCANADATGEGAANARSLG